MTKITSPHNPQLKSVKRLQSKRERARSSMFLAEGEDLIAAARNAGWPVQQGYRVAGSMLGGEGFVDVEEQALASVSTLGSGTRAIGVYSQRWAERAEGPLCVYLHGVGDPGNVGTILRSAHAFGASSVAIGPDCADPYGPKAVRASMGAIFSLPLTRAEVDDLPGELIGLAAQAPDALRGPLAGDVSLLIGSERHGLPPAVLARCDRLASIPQAAGDSLNAAMAATVALYELTRRSGS
jgi:RNA methyltransferase, TrmH family